MTAQLIPLVDEGLGNSAYLLDLGDGRAGEPTSTLPGERAMGAASLLERAGRRDVAVLQRGPEDWVETTGRSLETVR